jgi:hypothetical protein
MGRPKQNNPRNRQLNIGLTDSERDRLMRRSAAAGMRPVDYARARLFAGRALPEAVTASGTHLDPLLLHHLSRIGSNLNQIARQLNALRLPIPLDLEPVLRELRAILRNVAQS